jgi:hypothetical protein
MNTIVLQGLDLFARVWMLPVAVAACVMVAWIGWRIDARRRTRLARLGDVPNYAEPFFGSGAVLLARPDFTGRRTETVNDLDGFVANFWRALQADPDGVTQWADWPVLQFYVQGMGDQLKVQGRPISGRTGSPLIKLAARIGL